MKKGIIDKFIIYPITELLVKPAHFLGLKPNYITTITLVIRIISLYLFYNKKNLYLAFSLYFISWFTDALDGSVARKYNLGTKFGEYYDMLVDVSTTISLFIVLYTVYYKNNLSPLIISGIIIIMNSLLVLTKSRCEENKKEWEEGLIKNIIKKVFYLDCKNTFTKKVDLGPGVIYLYIMLFLFYTANNH